jgi:flagellar basal-body rod protein FlgF
VATGLWTAVSGAASQAHAVDTVANNLANADTQGFKKDLPAFREYLSSVEREKDSLSIPQGPIRDRDLVQLDGRDQSFVIVDGTYTHFKQGPLRVTQNPLDVALDGPGFLEVSTPSGIRYTRQGSLKMATDGRLVTAEGFPVLALPPGGLADALPASAVQPSQGGLPTQGGVAAEQGQPGELASRFISLQGNGPVSISPAGEIVSGGNVIARINVVEFKDSRLLRKSGSVIFENRDPNNRVTTPGTTSVRQGMIEGSNVNPVEEMTNLIRANRLFEQDMKALKTYGDLMGREANDIGKF